MLKITSFSCENLTKGCVTDEPHPRFSFRTQSDRSGAALQNARIEVNGWSQEGTEQIGVVYQGAKLQPFTTYEAILTATDDAGEGASESVTFETGRMEIPWEGKWITDGSYQFRETKVSPVPMLFRRRFALSGSRQITQARIYSTAMGIYEIELNRQKVGKDYFAPGFTSYKARLQYQTYDVTEQLSQNRDNELLVTVSGGWAVGSYVFTRKNRISADRQALLLELRIRYTDGSEEVIGTDTDWEVTMDGPVTMADIYDGETYDATKEVDANTSNVHWTNASIEKIRHTPNIFAQTGVPVCAHEEMKPISIKETKEGLLCDFGQNFAGVIHLKLWGKCGQIITVRHAEILNPDGTINTAFLRTAKATATYTCKDGEQEYSPRFTYMGFRYALVSGIEKEQVEITARALYSDLRHTGSFSCSDEKINRLQQNILWSSRSNLVEIPTDCPQRDERMGWTGDIAVFAPTACYNYDMKRFLNKWLADMRAEQLPTGGIPNTIPSQGYGFPATMPVMAIEFWGDASIMVPWAMYQATGDVSVLEENYEMMKKYVNACRFWAGLLSVGKHRYLWHTPAALHFGDWVAPDVPQMSQWQKRSKWTATASLQHTSDLLSQIAGILGHGEDEKLYRSVSEKTADAYVSLLTDGNGKMKEEFQTAYVLPLYFDMFDQETARKAADNLDRLVRDNNYCIGTGFPGTPYILFALADNGHEETAYRMLFNETCPSWLYEVRSGATTIWERWDGLDENGICPIGDDGTDSMISYNHYASGAVGDFLYRRVLGIEPTQPGYRTFTVAPILSDRLTKAEGQVETPYGDIRVNWTIAEKGTCLRIQVEVPMGSSCILKLPDGTQETLVSGMYVRSCKLQ